MSLSSRMIVTRVARQVADASTSSAAASFTPVKKVKEDTSGLTPIEVGITLAILLGVFILLIIVGELCKIFNKPKTKALPYVSGQKQKLFQPSAAGYGTRVAGQTSVEGQNQYSSRAGLMSAASPMGRGGRPDDLGDVSIGTPGSNHGGTDYFGKAGHTRGQSSGIKLPGATAATSRKGTAAHPALPGTPVAPDGSGFQVGRVMNYDRGGPGPSGYASRPAGLSPSERTPGPRTTSNVGMGSPPASDAKRRSKYARADGRRVDSVGPGTLRKSMYLDSNGQPVEGMPKSTSGNNLKRVDSVGRGDHRRKSTFTTDPMRSENRGQSIYNAADGGKPGALRDPLDARRPMMPSSAGSNAGYQARAQPNQQLYQQQQQQPFQQRQQQQQQRPYQQQSQQQQQQQRPPQQQMSMPPIQRQVSPMPVQSNGQMLQRPMQPVRGFSGMSAGGYGPPIANGYDMKSRQVV